MFAEPIYEDPDSHLQPVKRNVEISFNIKLNGSRAVLRRNNSQPGIVRLDQGLTHINISASEAEMFAATLDQIFKEIL